MNFPKNLFVPKTNRERQLIDISIPEKRNKFNAQMLKDLERGFEIPRVEIIPQNVYPYSQKYSNYSYIKYGKIGDIGSAGCGPLAVEYAIRLLGFSVSFEEIVEEIVEKGYRAYIFNDNDEIINGAGTEYSLFDNLATELNNVQELIISIKNGCPVTLLISNAIYHDDDKRKGNHFITIIGIDDEENAILMDGNKIERENDSKSAVTKIKFTKIISGLYGAWYWDKEKVKSYL